MSKMPQKRSSGSWKRGEHHHKARLTEKQVLAIADEISFHTYASLARKYKVGTTTIYNIVNGHTWKHLFAEK